MPANNKDLKQYRILIVVVAGFLTGLMLLFFLIATDV